MYRTRYYRIFKTKDPSLVICGVYAALPKIHTTLNSVKQYYEVEQLQKDSIYLELMTEYHTYNGCDFIPLYFEDQCEKLKRLPKIEDNLNGKLYWCICKKSKNYIKNGEYTSKYNMPNSIWFRNMLEYFVNNYEYEHKSITGYLVNNLIKQYIYENTKHFSDKQKQRRFQLIENSYLNKEFKCKEDYLNLYNEIYKKDIYELMFNYFRK